MKNTLFLVAFFFGVLRTTAQDTLQAQPPNITVKWAPTGLLLGSVSLQAEYNFGEKNSLTAKIGLPVRAHHSLTFNQQNADFTMKAISFLAGFRTYFSTKHLRGLYYEPFFKYVHHSSEGLGEGTLNNRKALFSFTNNYNGIGVGVQLGAQFFIGRRFVLDLFFLGPEINSASNSFKAMEVSNTLPWTSEEAGDAKREIWEFIDKIPFIRHRTTILVDSDNKRVNAQFKGTLPGLRTGFSIGFAF